MVLEILTSIFREVMVLKVLRLLVLLMGKRTFGSVLPVPVYSLVEVRMFIW